MLGMDVEPNLSPPQRLAVAYARRDLREVFSLLLEFDNRLMAIAAKGQETLIKQLRLAWWREQIGKGRDVRPTGEPLLARLSACENPERLVSALQSLVDAWERIVSAEGDRESPEVAAANQTRAVAIFGNYAHWATDSCNSPEAVRVAGERWARGSLGLLMPDNDAKRLPGLKPLNLLQLAYAVDGNANGLARFRIFIRMSWHGLTGM
jgi:15-cis-phytoene synthase